jgi:hypothetical protein
MAELTRKGSDAWELVMDDTELQILAEAMRSRPYHDMPNLNDRAVSLRHGIQRGVNLLSQRAHVPTEVPE